MSVRKGSLVTTRPELLAARLGTSWSERATVTVAGGQLTLRWKTGQSLTLQSSPGLLSIELKVPPGEAPEDFIDVVSRALQRLEPTQPLLVAWV